jgi:hypothetical protein
VGAFGGAWVAARIACGAPVLHGLFVGILFLAAGVVNLQRYPHPLWFNVLTPLIFLPVAFLGAKCVRQCPVPVGQLADPETGPGK